MARKKARHGPSLDQKMMGPKPTWTPEEFAAIPADKKTTEWIKGSHWYYYFRDKKKSIIKIAQYGIDVLGWTQKEATAFKRVQDYKINIPLGSFVDMQEAGWIYDSEVIEEKHALMQDLLKEGELIKAEKDENKPKKQVISIAERTKMKVLDTVFAEWDEEIVDAWFEGDFTKKFSCYNRFKGHGLKGNAINIFKDMLLYDYNVIKDAYNRSCDQAVEAYSHIGKADKRKMMKQYEEVFSDLEKLRTSFKAARVPRAKKPKTSDKQVARLQYCQENIDAKLASINPVMIPGKHKLYVYNLKQKRLAEYSCDSTHGFEISGTSIKNFDDSSRTAILRKPDVMLPDILSRTEKQIDKLWSGITTKITKPTGRINKDCILLRVL